MTNSAYASGATDATVYVRGFTEATGAPYTAGAFNTPTLVLQYIRNRGLSTTTGFTPVTQTAAGVHADGGFVHVAGGLYRVDLPDAAIAAGADSVIILATGISGVTFTAARLDLLGADPRSTSVDANIKQINGTTILGNGSTTRFTV